MVRPALAVFFVAFFSATATAQTTVVTGTVVDARTGQALANVVISIDNPQLSIDTDAVGHFELTVPAGQHVLTASFVGYALFRQAVAVNPGENPPLLIRLSEGAGQFEERVTVAGNAPDRAESVPAGVSLHGREFQALRGITLDDPLRAMQSLPSVAATDDFYSEFAVRGNAFRHVGLVVDGIPSKYLMHSVYGITDGGSIAIINSDAVGSLSLLPGTYPEQFGRHLGAQVGIELREGDREKVRTRAGLSGTSAAFLTEGPLPGHRGSWLASARRSYLDLLLKRIDEENSLAFGFTDAEAKVVLDVTRRHQLEALVIAGASQFNEKPDNLGTNDEADINGHTWLSALTWRYTPSARFAVTHKAYATGLTFLNRNRTGGVLDTSSSADLGWRADATAALRPGVLFEFGADAQHLAARHRHDRALNDGTELTTLADYNRTGRAFSGYVQAAVTPLSRVTITPGVRGDYWGPTTESTASPWILADVALTSTTHLRGGTGVYRQFADFEQIAGLQGGGDRLRAETAQHVDLGLSQQLPRDLTLQITGYLRNEDDVLWTPGSEPRRVSPNTFRLGLSNAPWINVLRGRARGVELVLRRDSPTRLSGWAGYAFGRDRYTDTATGDTFWADYDQRHALSLFGQYRLSNRTTIGAKFRYGSNYPLVGYIGAQPVSSGTPPLLGGSQPLFYALVDTRNTLRLPSYARLDVRADRTFTWSGRRVTLFGEVANALNHENLRNVPYGVDRRGRVLEPTDTLLPIVPSAGLVIEF